MSGYLLICNISGGDSKFITQADIDKAINKLDNPQQQDFIKQCIHPDPKQRPSARDLLLHPGIFEVHSLKLLAAHAIVKNQHLLPENQNEVPVNKENVIAEYESKKILQKDIPLFDVDKFLEDVKNGIYPLTAYRLPQPPTKEQTISTSDNEQDSDGRPSSDQGDEPIETRKIVQAQCSMTELEDKPAVYQV